MIGLVAETKGVLAMTRRSTSIASSSSRAEDPPPPSSCSIAGGPAIWAVQPPQQGEHRPRQGANAGS